MATIATSTIATPEIERPSSPTPSEGSIYYDLDDEIEIPSTSSSSISTGTTTHSDPPTEVEQNAPEQIVEPPSTPPARPTISLPNAFSSPEMASSSSSEGSSTSVTLSDTDNESPTVTQSRNSSFDFASELKPWKPLPIFIEEEPCLQCHLAGMTCSFAPRQHNIFHFRRRNGGTCTRCARNGKSFCIAQIKVERVDRGLWDKESPYKTIYYAEGVDKEVVLEKAESMLEEKAQKMRFVLPKGSDWKREKLRVVFRGSWKKEGADESGGN